MADLPDYDPYAECELNRNSHCSDISAGLSFPGTNVEKAEGNSRFTILFAQRMHFSRPVEHVKEAPLLGFSPLGLRAICICLHLLLVVIHVGLFVVWWHRFENRVVIPLSRSGNISSVIVVISQIFTTVCARRVSM